MDATELDHNLQILQKTFLDQFHMLKIVYKPHVLVENRNYSLLMVIFFRVYGSHLDACRN